MNRLNINEIINDIVSRVDNSWSVLSKVRFAYVELGKYLQKNTDFFFSVDNKLQGNNLSFEEIEKIYNEDVVLSTSVICKSSSVLLKTILDRLGIESKLVKSMNNSIPYEDNGNKIDIYHWFLAVKDSDGEYFFCTLSSDLPYVQMDMETKHFGTHIPYKKKLSDGTLQQVYEGEEIHNKVIGTDELRKVDEEIGYVKEYYMYDRQSRSSKDFNLHYANASYYMLRDAVKANKLFYELELQNTDFIRGSYSFVGENGRQISFYDQNVNSLSVGDWQIWIKNICRHVEKKIWDIIGYQLYPIPPLDNPNWNYEAWLFSLSCMIEDEIYNRLDVKSGADYHNVRIDVTDFSYNKWSKKVKSNFIYDRDYEFENIIMLLDKLNALVNYINGKNKNGNLSSLFSSLSYHFINPNHLYINNILDSGKLSNDYIANKFNLMFSRVFSCNDTITQFNRMSYSEQVVILKEVLGIIFPEITVANSGMIAEYDHKFSPVLNRIQLFPIKNNTNGEYAMVFAILGEPDKEENEYYFFYDLKTNEFKVCDILGVYQNYTIVSNRMKNKFSVEDLENLESQRKR